MSVFFVNRPIVAMVLSIIIVILGLVAMISLPIAQFPDIVPPEIQIIANYTGADALQVEEAVAAPIEQQVTGVDDMIYMRSFNDSSGTMSLRVDFKISTNPNDDQNNVSVRLQNALSQLPNSVQAQGLTLRKATTSPLMWVTVYSPNNEFDKNFLANYTYINLNDPLTRVYGVGQVNVYGAGQYAMRMWVKPDQLAKLEINVSDIINSIKAQNAINPSGQVGAEPVPPGQEMTYIMRTQGRLVTAEEFGDIILRANKDGSFVRIRDVAQIELGVQAYNVTSRYNGGPAAVIGILQLPGTNAIKCAQEVRALMAQMSQRFPPGIAYDIALDTTLAVTAGIEDIIKTLWEALVLVIIVVFVFLQSWRATLIPLLTVPVSLIGAFLFFVPLGFSINTLSLFGLVLAIGLVVDDAIVVVEAVEHHIEHGLSPKQATIKAMSEVTGPVVAIALILAAVFVPTAAIPGITGRLYQQFALAIAVSVLISAFNALTLSPALCALLLRPRAKSGGPLGKFYAAFNTGFTHATNGYARVCHLLVRKTAIAMFFLLAMAVGAGLLGRSIPSSFLPEEDQGYFYINLALPPAASLQRTEAVAIEIEKVLKEFPEIQGTINVMGYSFIAQVRSTYFGFLAAVLKPWEQRPNPEQSAQSLIERVNARLQQSVPGAISFAFPPPAIPGIGTAGGFSFMLEDRGGNDVAYLVEWMDKFMAAARKRPEVASINTVWVPSVPQKYVDIDRDKVTKLGLSITDVYQTLSAFMGGAYVDLFNRFGRVWQVYVQSVGDYRRDARQIDQFYIRNKDNQMVPLSTLARITDKVGPEFTNRFNEYRAVELIGGSAKGYSSDQVMTALEEVARDILPRDVGYDWNAMSYQEDEARKGLSPMVIFGLSLLFVFLIMAAQYESWSLPMAVLLGTPIAVFGAFVALVLRGFENDVYAQIGLVMLIGLAAKNAILIVEFAKLKYDEGMEIIDAAMEGARLRLRPILMTAFAFILGTVPLAVANGSGAVSRQVLGSTVIGGMLAATGIAIFIIPVCFVVIMTVFKVQRRERAGTKTAGEAPELGGQSG